MKKIASLMSVGVLVLAIGCGKKKLTETPRSSQETKDLEIAETKSELPISETAATLSPEELADFVPSQKALSSFANTAPSLASSVSTIGAVTGLAVGKALDNTIENTKLYGEAVSSLSVSDIMYQNGENFNNFIANPVKNYIVDPTIAAYNSELSKAIGEITVRDIMEQNGQNFNDYVKKPAGYVYKGAKNVASDYWTHFLNFYGLDQ